MEYFFRLFFQSLVAQTQTKDGVYLFQVIISFFLCLHFKLKMEYVRLIFPVPPHKLWQFCTAYNISHIKYQHPLWKYRFFQQALHGTYHTNGLVIFVNLEMYIDLNVGTYSHYPIVYRCIKEWTIRINPSGFTHIFSKLKINITLIPLILKPHMLHEFMSRH